MFSVKNKRGFSLVELLVVVAIIGILSAIAIPSFNRYKKEARKTAFSTDLQNLYKAVTIFGALQDNFCVVGSDATDDVFSLENIGMNTLVTSPTYTTAANANNFIGFGAATCPGVTAAVKPKHFVSPGTTKDAHCTLTASDFTVGVVGNIDASTLHGWQINREGVRDDHVATGTTAAVLIGFACVP